MLCVADPTFAQNVDPKATEKPPAADAKDAAKKADEFAEAEKLLGGPAANPECLWLGRRVVSLLWRDDLDTAFRHLDLYDRFGCPAGHIQMAFRCVVRQGNIDPKATDSPTAGCTPAGSIRPPRPRARRRRRAGRPTKSAHQLESRRHLCGRPHLRELCPNRRSCRFPKGQLTYRFLAAGARPRGKFSGDQAAKLRKRKTSAQPSVLVAEKSFRPRVRRCGRVGASSTA